MQAIESLKRSLWLIAPAIIVTMLAGVYFSYRGVEASPVSTGTDSENVITLHDPDDSKNPKLEIAKIGVAVPVIMNVSGTKESEYLKALEEGVAHYSSTADIGNKGNAFIFGHSSYYENKPGNYKDVFKKLNEVKNDDLFSVTRQGVGYQYKVFISKIISDVDFSVLDQPQDKEIVTIMTCWPPGTTDKRYIIQGERIN